MSNVMYQFGPRLTPTNKKIIIINVLAFFMFWIYSIAESNIGVSRNNQLLQFFALSKDHLLSAGRVWQLVTYMFFHIDPFHLLFNMMAVWMFGSDLEEKWGSKLYLKYYLICGIGAGFFIAFLPVLIGQPSAMTLGASGAVFGILLAYAIYWPDRRLLFMFIFPIKTRYFVLIMGVISLYFTFNSGQSGNISHVGHLGGLITGYLYLLWVAHSSGRSSHAQISFWKRINPFYRIKMNKQRKLWLKRQQELFEMDDMETRVDKLLDKISKQGYKSLSEAEKKFLKKASEQMNKQVH